jgi:hypothetical protein
VKEKIAAILLLLTLLFSQLGVNFFHSSHEEHSLIKRASKNQSKLVPHGEHCTVCSIDLLHGLVFKESQIFSFHTFTCTPNFNFVAALHKSGNTALSGRAPPLFIL